MKTHFILTIDDIAIEVQRKKIKNIRLSVLPPDGSVRLSVPVRVTEEYIVRFLHEKLDWIQKKRDPFLAHPKSADPEYVSGEALPVFGECYTLRVVYGKGKPSVIFAGREILLTVGEDSTVEERAIVIKEWYRSILREKVTLLLPEWEKRTGLYSDSWQIRSMKTRWGTCNTVTRKIWLNLELAKKPAECLEYVLLHELAHLRVPNHGKDFYEVLDCHMPDWKERKNLLNGRRSG